MKRIIIAITALFMSVAGISAQRLSDISFEAQYITDKMVVELGLSSQQRSRILQLNMGYLDGIASYRDIDSKIWRQRNSSLKALLSHAQWLQYKKADYFYRPIGWSNGAYVHRIYAKYPNPKMRPTCPKPPKGYGKPGRGGGSKWDKRQDKRRDKDAGKPGRGDSRRDTFGSRR